MKKIVYSVLFVLFFLKVDLYAQEGEVEIFLIDSFATPELPHVFVLSFFTTDSVTSKLVFNKKIEKEVTTELSDNHKIKFDLTDIKIDSSYIPFEIYVYDKNGIESKSETFQLFIPYKKEMVIKNDPGLLFVCLGGIVFSLPSPTLFNYNGENYFSLVKEIPLITYYSGGYNYPDSYISMEYAYVFNAPVKNFMRLGYKQIYQIPVIEYVSPGLNLFTDFLGFNGVSPEVSIGWFKISNVFTVFSKYRYNFKPGEKTNDFHELTIGLYSDFFSINF
ncbi:MAG: hypothetical protein KJ571_00900 [Bacteroidetes bacterium]|nr:hypothetical protein [Bacteroidota bacterium]